MKVKYEGIHKGIYSTSSLSLSYHSGIDSVSSLELGARLHKASLAFDFMVGSGFCLDSLDRYLSTRLCLVFPVLRLGSIK